MLLYPVIYPELEVSQEGIFDADGIQWGGTGRTGPDAPSPVDSWNAWKKAVEKQLLTGFTSIPLYVKDYYSKAKDFTRPPTQKELDFTLVLTNHNISIGWNAPKEPEKEVKDKPFTWSCSALNSFEVCPHYFAEERIYKRVKRVYSQEANWGIEVHDAIAYRLKGGPETSLVKPYAMWTDFLIRCAKDDFLVEKQFAITKDYKPAEWFGKNVWGRGIVDVALLRGDWCGVYDWKTGKRREDPTELEIFNFFMALNYPQIQKFDSAYIFLKEKDPSKAVVPLGMKNRKDVMEAWLKILTRIKRMEEAVKCRVFSKKTSGLCNGWCSITDCEHWKEKR